MLNPKWDTSIIPTKAQVTVPKRGQKDCRRWGKGRRAEKHHMAIAVMSTVCAAVCTNLCRKDIKVGGGWVRRRSAGVRQEKR